MKAELGRAYVEFSTDHTSSALQERYCEPLFRGPKMAIASLHLFAVMSCLLILSLWVCAYGQCAKLCGVQNR